MSRSLLMVTIAGETAAIDTDVVQSVIEIEHVSPVPCVPRHVAGLSAMRSRAITIIDCRRSLELPDSAEPEGDEPLLAVAVEIDGFHYGLVIDAVADVISIDGDASEVRTTLEKGWARVSQGMVQTPAGPAQLLDVRQLIEGPRKPLAA